MKKIKKRKKLKVVETWISYEDAAKCPLRISFSIVGANAGSKDLSVSDM